MGKTECDRANANTLASPISASSLVVEISRQLQSVSLTSQAAAHSDVDAPCKLLDDALINQHPTLALRALSASLHYSPHQASATAAEISLNESLQAQLRTLLVADSRVPQDYAGFRSLVLNATASA